MADDEYMGNIDKPPHEVEGALKFSTDRQVKIWQALGGLHPELGSRIASIYEGIIIALASKNPEKISIVAHLARELSTILPIYISGLPVRQIRASDDEVRSELDSILKMLGSHNEADQKIREIVEGLLSKIPEQTSHREHMKKVLGSHPLLGSRPTYLNDAFIKQWIDSYNYFTKHCHHPDIKNRQVDSLVESKFVLSWDTLETLFYRLLVREPFFDAIQEIDRLLAVITPTEQDADGLMRHIVEPQHRRYFFDKCANPNWLGLLKKRGAFSSPQESLKKDGYVQFVPWPESQYLSKVAKTKPEEVYEIIKELTSENQSVLDDFLRAALQSPAYIASRYVEIIIKNKWMRSLYNLRLPDEVAELMEKLAKEGQGEYALKIANELFSLRIDQTVGISDDQNIPFSFVHPEVKPYFDDWQFAEIIHNKTKELAQLKPLGLFSIYTEKLKEAIELEKRENTPDDFYEYSHIWRPNLLKVTTKHKDTKNTLVDGLVSLMEQYRNAPERLKEFAEVLQSYPYSLFRRLEMCLYKYSPTDYIIESERLLRRKEIIIAYNLRREYLPLLGAVYEKFSDEAKSDILRTIEEGPNFKKDENYTNEEFDQMRDNWKALYLNPIKNYLPTKQAQEYTEIVKKYGETIDDDGEVKVWNGGQSPISLEELSRLSVEETVQFFVDYKMPDDPFGRYSSGGLGLIFADLVTENPEKYTLMVNLFFEKKIRPVYFYFLIRGLRDTLRKDRCFSWEPIIDLCYKIVVKNEHETEAINSDEQNWNSVNYAIIDLLEEALKKSACDISISLKERVWEIISKLAEDPNPTPEDEHKDNEGGLDPMTLAINTTRGEAIHAVINYGLWVARNLSDKSIEVKMPPEMEQLLDVHLDVKHDPALAIRSVYGWRLPNLFYLNKQWLINNKQKIFFKDAPDYLIAVWEGYLANDVIKEVFTILKDEYYGFIPYLGTIEKTGYRATDIDQRFPQHVAIVYTNGLEHDDLVWYFFDNAPAKSRAAAINFIGRVILRQIETFTEKHEVKKRLAQLWDKRIALPQVQIDIEELQEFGWWFKVSPFDRKETLDRTIKTLQLLKGLIDVPYEIVEELIAYATEFPFESITILDLLARADKEAHEYLYKKEEYIKIIKLVKETGHEEAKQSADQLINYMGSIGLIEDFRNLL